MNTSCIILAGGRSLRLGRDKTSEVLFGQSLLARSVQRLKRLGNHLILAISDTQNLTYEILDYNEIRIVGDKVKGHGPLVGIYSGLFASTTEKNIVVACDMPFVNTDLLKYMSGIADGFDAVVPKVGSLVEPLCAVYARSCMTTIDRMFKERKLGVRHLLNQLNVRYVTPEEIDCFDTDHLSFFNINTEEDLIKARQIAFDERAYQVKEINWNAI